MITTAIVQPNHWWVVPAAITLVSIASVVCRDPEGHPIVKALTLSLRLNLVLSASLIAWIIGGFMK